MSYSPVEGEPVAIAIDLDFVVKWSKSITECIDDNGVLAKAGDMSIHWTIHENAGM